MLKTVIGQIDIPFQVTLIFTSCMAGGRGSLALDSLDFIDCELGESLVSYKAVVEAHREKCLETSYIVTFGQKFIAKITSRSSKAVAIAKTTVSDVCK